MRLARYFLLWCRFHITLACLLLSVSVSDTFALELESISFATVSDTNPAKAQQEVDIESTYSLQSRLNIAFDPIDLTDHSALVFDGQAQFTTNRINELGKSVFGMGAVYLRHIESLGEPTMSLRVDATYLDSETDNRDSSQLDIAVAGSWEPSPFYDLTLGSRLVNRKAKSSVFNTRSATLFGQFNYYMTESLTLTSALSYQTGQVVSTATPSLSIVNNASVIEPDGAFGGHDARRFAYKLDATSVIVGLGIEYALSDAISADLSFQSISTKAVDPIEYDRNLMTLTMQYFF